jgi:hypothetical protein
MAVGMLTSRPEWADRRRQGMIVKRLEATRREMKNSLFRTLKTRWNNVANCVLAIVPIRLYTSYELTEL